jgi:hypothetical protein
VGAIAGGVVGGLVALIAILCLILFCLHRRKKAGKQMDEQRAELPPPVELGVTTPPQEMPTPGMGKYMPLYQHQENTLPYSGDISLHSPHSAYAQHSSGPTSPTRSTPHGSPYETGFMQPTYPQSTHAQSSSWDQYAQYSSTMDSRVSQQNYPSPVTSSHPSSAPPQEAQLYYPPPREPRYQTVGVSPVGHGGYEAMRYQDDVPQLQPPVSTMSTPTQFYVRPAAVGGEAEAGHMQRTSQDDRYNGGGVLEPQRRPKYGKFVEVGHT